MKKISKVVSVLVGSSWQSTNGDTMHTHDYVMEDGQKIQTSHKEQNKFSVGNEVEYEVKSSHPTYGDKGSVGKVNTYGGGGGGYKPDTVGITVGACLNLSVSMFNHGKIDKDKIVATADWLIEQSFALKSKHSNKS
jgi:hypothetical protein